MYLDVFGFTSLPLERDHPPLVWEGRKYWCPSIRWTRSLTRRCAALQNPRNPLG